MSVISHKEMVMDKWQYTSKGGRGIHKEVFMRIYHPVHHGIHRQNFGYISGATMRHLGYPKHLELMYATKTHELTMAGTTDIEYGCHIWKVGDNCAGISLNTFMDYCGVGKLKAGRVYGKCAVTDAGKPYVVFKLEEE